MKVVINNISFKYIDISTHDGTKDFLDNGVDVFYSVFKGNNQISGNAHLNSIQGMTTKDIKSEVIKIFLESVKSFGEVL